MKSNIVIGIDIGGSHITSAAVNINDLSIVANTTFSVKINNKSPKIEILENWGSVINSTLESSQLTGNVRLGFAIPGPFQYHTGLALFNGLNDKYGSLYNSYIPNELIHFLDRDIAGMRFINDATAFGVGAASTGRAKSHSKTIAITLGTGFGSAFIKDGVPLIASEGVPSGGCLWDKPYKDGIGDDYFSTRWCVQRYLEISGKQVTGVKEIAKSNDSDSRAVFMEFGSNLAKFMIPFLEKYKPDLIILGGNVSKANSLFLPIFKSEIENFGIHTNFEISELMEDAALIGSARLFDTELWEQVKNDLTNL